MLSGIVSQKFEPYKKKPVININHHNRRNFTTRGLDESLSDVIMLNPLDFYKIFRWVNRKDMDLIKFKDQKIVFYTFPVNSSTAGIFMQQKYKGKFYICMEPNEIVEGNWKLKVRAEEYLRAQGYRIACLIK